MGDRAVVEHQRMLDSTLPLLAHRGRALEAIARGDRLREADIVARGPDLSSWTMAAAAGWGELLSTRPVTRAQDLARSLSNNRCTLRAGLRMRSVFDVMGTEPGALRMLHDETARGVYYEGPAPIQMRIVDRSFVLVSGPTNQAAILRLSSRSAVDAALVHWAAVTSRMRPCRMDSSGPSALSGREHMVLDLLRSGATDRTIAASLGLSVRTVQAVVTTLMQQFGVASRFALGYAYAVEVGVAPGRGLREHADEEHQRRHDP